MKVYYISPSTIPSRSANSIHVVNMCEGLNQLGYEVVLFAHSNSCNSLNCQKQLKNIYGVDNRKINLKVFHSKKNRGIEFIIALRALIYFTLDFIKNGWTAVPQDSSRATIFSRRQQEDSEITLKEIEGESAQYLYDKIRMLEDPYPNAFIKCSDGRKLFLKYAELEPENSSE